jgi:carboxyl-terminal processing protease
MPQRNLLILLIATAISYACHAVGEQNPFARYAARGLREIEDGALERVPNEELFNAAMDGMVGVLHKRGDEHSEFIDREDTGPFKAEMLQQFGGIGVRIRFTGEPPQLVVVGAPDPGTPAARADVRAGDRILAIDDRPTDGMTMSDVLHAMRGEPGEPVRLSIQHAGAERPTTLTLIREVITVNSILGDRRTADGGWEFRLQRDPRIALVRITTFANHTAQELQRTLSQLTDAGVGAAVIDLRDNAGGALDTAVAVCDMLLPAGLPIVEIRGRDGVLDDRYETTGRGHFQNLPLAVLVNNNSASASEIVAACLQDHHRAVVVGQRSYGKGTVQKLIPAESGQSLLKLTTASYWRPSGRNIHRAPDASESDDWGVSPDPGFNVPFSEDQYEAYRQDRSDRDLITASPPDETGDSTAAAAGAGQTKPEFVDRQLEKAVDYLQDQLIAAALVPGEN